MSLLLNRVANEPRFIRPQWHVADILSILEHEDQQHMRRYLLELTFNLVEKGAKLDHVETTCLI